MICSTLLEEFCSCSSVEAFRGEVARYRTMLVPMKALTCVANSDDIGRKQLIPSFVGQTRVLFCETATSEKVGVQKVVTFCQTLRVRLNRTDIMSYLEYVAYMYEEV